MFKFKDLVELCCCCFLQEAQRGRAGGYCRSTCSSNFSTRVTAPIWGKGPLLNPFIPTHYYYSYCCCCCYRSFQEGWNMLDKCIIIVGVIHDRSLSIPVPASPGWKGLKTPVFMSAEQLCPQYTPSVAPVCSHCVPSILPEWPQSTPTVAPADE